MSTFDLNKIEFLDKLGEGTNIANVTQPIGAFGKVRLAKLPSTGVITEPGNRYPSPVKQNKQPT